MITTPNFSAHTSDVVPGVEATLEAVSPAPVLITEREVAFATAARRTGAVPDRALVGQGDSRCQHGRLRDAPDVDSGLPPDATGLSAALHIPGERAHVTRDGPTMNPRETATVDRSSCPNVFDAGLPVLAYEHLQNPDDAHRLIAQARNRAPIAMGTHGPELVDRYDRYRALRPGHRHCPPISDCRSSAHCSARRRRIGSCFPTGTDDIFQVFDWDVATHERVILAAWDELDAYIDHMVARRRHALTDAMRSPIAFGARVRLEASKSGVMTAH